MSAALPTLEDLPADIADDLAQLVYLTDAELQQASQTTLPSQDAERMQSLMLKRQEDIMGVAFTIDHIIPESLGGRTVLDNICLACWGCNLTKRNRIVGIDPRTSAVVRLFNPNTQQWLTADQHPPREE